MKLDEWLFKNRKAWNGRKLAEKLEITRGYLSKILNGRCKPSIKIAKRVDQITEGQVPWQSFF